MQTLRLILSFVVAFALGVAPALAHDVRDDVRNDDPREASGDWDGTVDAQDADPRALTEFREVLDPHGEWYQHPEFGLVWVPSRALVGENFVPYLTDGRWGIDSHGNWVWQSDYAFGWVVFHYGRWVEVPGIGWAWIPGYVYAPAWVVWGSPMTNITYVGWAPMGPSFVWVDGVAVVVVGVWSPYWVFCRSHYAFSPRLHLHVVKDHRRHEYLSRRTVRREVPSEPRPTHEWYTPMARGGGVQGDPAPRSSGPEVTGDSGSAKPLPRPASRVSRQHRDRAAREILLPPRAAAASSTAGAKPPRQRVEPSDTRLRTEPEQDHDAVRRAARRSTTVRAASRPALPTSKALPRSKAPPRRKLRPQPAKLKPKRKLEPLRSGKSD